MFSFKQSEFDFKDLFIFEMANNHQGIVEHGLAIIKEMADITKRVGVRGALKLQFRDLDTFIHPSYKDSKSNKHIPRFLSTRLSEEQFAKLIRATKESGMISIVTPFDEPSVDRIERLGVDVIKVGSCSAMDWPLLERVAEAGKPVICSTGGLKIHEIDQIVSFFQHRGVHFALMHCVSMYPTPPEKLQLNLIETFRNRYPGVTVGFSTHEDPTNFNAVQLAYAKGARLFEKHVGLPTEDIKLNTYSATPEQVEKWLLAYKEAALSCGVENSDRVFDAKEDEDLKSLMRGVFLKKDVRAGIPIHRSDIFFAMPIQEGQLSSGKWRNGIVADQDYRANDPLNSRVRPNAPEKKEIIYSTIHAVKGMLNMARIPLGHEFSVELSHHYGIERFGEIGSTLVECINREYAKKLIVQLPGQWNPVHYHKRKDETFQILAGTLEVELEGKRKTLHAGDTLWVPRGIWHGFGTETGVIFEEVSTTSYPNDSFYVDRGIAKKPRDERKTYLRNWGRHQFDDIDDRIVTEVL